MATTTLELIFSGLLLLSLPEGDGEAVVVFPDDDGHQMNLVLVEGSLGEGCRSWEQETGLPVLRLSELYELRDLRMAVEELGGASGLRWMEGTLKRAPESSLESGYINWVPSLSAMVLGQSRLRGRCRERDGDCRWADARFFLDRGEISTCHLVHPIDVAMSRCPADDESESTDIPVTIYDLPDGGQHALADSIAVRHSFDSEKIVLVVGGDPCELRSENGPITLFIANAPLAPDYAPDHHRLESHFRLLHRFSENLFQRMDRSQPSALKDYKPVSSDWMSCENSIRCAHEAINRRSGVGFLFAHSPTECGTATQP